MPEHELDLMTALGHGDPEAVASLIAAGADIRYRSEQGYDALLAAVHSRDVARDPRLLDLLGLLIASGVDLNAITTYKESGLRVLSRIGRFDAVRLLLDAGADKSHLQWTPLIEAVALGSLADVERLASGGAPLEETDWWERTAWLVALLGGDLAKVQLLRQLGANVHARGRCSKPPLFYAIEGHHPEVVRWLLDIFQDVEQKDEFGDTPLLCAVQYADLDCVDLLLGSGADVDYESNTGSAIRHAETREIAQRLLAGGADPGHLSQAGHRALCELGDVGGGTERRVEGGLHSRTDSHFRDHESRPHARAFWEAMIRAGSGSSGAAAFVGHQRRIA